MGPGEQLLKLTFDGISVLPGGTPTADGSGQLAGSFTIPANVPVGTKLVYAEGAAAKAGAFFVGAGHIDTTVMQRVTTIDHWVRPIVVAVTPQAQPVQPSGGGKQADSGIWGNNKPFDPMAQSFQPTELRQTVGVRFRLCAIGDTSKNLLIQQATMDNGIPTTEVMAQAFYPMAGATIGWKSAYWALPTTTAPEVQSAIVIGTDDPGHALSLARLGDFDILSQSYIGSQPYSVGVLFTSSNRVTWTPEQDADLTFKIIAARYPVHTKTVALGSFTLINASDLQVRAAVEIPSPDCSVVFRVTRPGGLGVYLLQPGQVLQLTEYLNETVTLEALLAGTEHLSPILFAPVFLIAGQIAVAGNYVTRAATLGAAVRLTSYLKCALPGNSTFTMEYDKADGNWLPLPEISSTVLQDPAWVEKKREATGLTGTSYRLRLTITGGPAARPRIGDLVAAVM